MIIQKDLVDYEKMNKLSFKEKDDSRKFLSNFEMCFEGTNESKINEKK